MFFTKAKNFSKRIVCVFCAVSLLFSEAGLLKPPVQEVHAEISAAEMASSMVDYYRQKNSVLGEITKEDVKSFGVFISNFYIPFQTNVLDETIYPNMVYNTMSVLKGDPNITEDDPVASLICGELQAPYINGCSMPALFEDGSTVTVKDLYSSETKTVYLPESSDSTLTSNIADTSKPVFKTGYNVSDKYSSDQNFTVILLTCLKVAAELKSQNTDFISDMVEILNEPLYVSSYGDLLSSSGYVIVPACLNPYVFSKDGDLLPINNTFFMGNLAVTKDLSSATSLFNSNFNNYDYPSSVKINRIPFKANPDSPIVDSVMSNIDTKTTPIFAIGYTPLIGSSVLNDSDSVYVFKLCGADTLKTSWFWTLFDSEAEELNTLLSAWIKPTSDVLVEVPLDNIYSDFANFTSQGALNWRSTSESNDSDIQIFSLLDSSSNANSIYNSPALDLLIPLFSFQSSLGDTDAKLTLEDFYIQFSSSTYYTYLCNYLKSYVSLSAQDCFDLNYNPKIDLIEPLIPFISIMRHYFGVSTSSETSTLSDADICSMLVDFFITGYYYYIYKSSFVSIAQNLNGLSAVPFRNSCSESDFKKLFSSGGALAIGYSGFKNSVVESLPNTCLLSNETNAQMFYFSLFDYCLRRSDSPSKKMEGDVLKELLFGYNTHMFSKSYYLYRLFAFNQSVAKILSLHKSDSNTIKSDKVCFFANFYYAYIVSLAQYEGWYFPDFEIGTNAADLLTSIQEEAAGQMDASKLLKAQWSSLQTYQKLTSTGGSNRADAFQKSFINNFFSNMFLAAHEGIVGTKSVGTSIADTGNVNNVGVITYGTIPRLNEMSLTAGLVKNYKFIYIGLMLVVFVSVIFMFLLQMKSLPKALLTLVAMSIVLAIPVSLVDSAIALTNKASSVAYTNKFKFWAIVQHQLDVQVMTEAVTSDENGESSESLSTADLTNAALQNKNYYSTTSVRLKWMSPKKLNVLDKLFGQEEETGLKLSLNVFKWLFSGYFQQESYSSDSLATYVYRPYSDLCLTALSMWENGLYTSEDGYISGFSEMIGSDKKNALSVIFSSEFSTSDISDITPESFAYYDISKLQPIEREISDKNTTDKNTTSYIDVEQLKCLSYFSTVLSKKASNSSINSDYLNNYYNLWNKNAYKANITDDKATAILFDSPEIFDAIYFSEVKDTYDNSTIGYGGLSEEDVWTGNSLAFMLYSESPFYYFYNVFKNSYSDDFAGYVSSVSSVSSESAESDGSAEGGLVDATGIFRPGSTAYDDTSHRVYGYEDSQASGLTGFSKLLISDDFFYANPNSKYAGKLKDFMGLEDLFCLIIPYLRNGNDYAREWISTFGNQFDFYAEEKTPEQIHTTNLEQVWALYSPWVDALVESWALPDEVKWGDTRYNIKDALNPYTYVMEDSNRLDRFMAFGEADIAAKGYGTKLTSVEKHIDNVLQKTYTDLRYLVNYSGFENEVLISMAAMLATFNFNEEFTKVGLNTVEMYPTGFELQNFSYDSYLRLILLNATGQDFLANSGTISIYKTVMEQSGTLVGLFIVLLDVFCVWILPAMKFVFVVAMLAFILIITLVLFFQSEEIAQLLKIMFAPLIKFVLVCLLHTYGTSVFMGDGLTGYVGTQSPVMVTNSTGVTLVVILALNLIVTLLYYKIIKKLLGDIKTWGATAISSFTSLPSEISKSWGNISSGFKSVMSNIKSKRRMQKSVRDGMLDAKDKSNHSGGASAVRRKLNKAFNAMGAKGLASIFADSEPVDSKSAKGKGSGADADKSKSKDDSKANATGTATPSSNANNDRPDGGKFDGEFKIDGKSLDELCTKLGQTTSDAVKTAFAENATGNINGTKAKSVKPVPVSEQQTAKSVKPVPLQPAAPPTPVGVKKKGLPPSSFNSDNSSN